MLNKTKAIVLYHVKFGESSLIVNLYTEKFGRLACMVNGVRSRKARFPATLFQPLSLLEADFYYRHNREIQRLKEASCPFHYNSIPFSISKSSITLFLAEVLSLTLREEESNPVLFSFLYHSLQLFDTKEEGSSSFHIWFMIQLTRYLGFFPPPQVFKEGVSFSSDIQAFHSLNAVTKELFEKMAESTQGPPEVIHLPQSDRNELLNRIIRYYSFHIDGFSRLKSYAVLQEVFRQSVD